MLDKNLKNLNKTGQLIVRFYEKNTRYTDLEKAGIVLTTGTRA